MRRRWPRCGASCASACRRSGASCAARAWRQSTRICSAPSAGSWSAPATRAPSCSSGPARRPTSACRAASRDSTDFALTDEQWDALMIPIDLAFFVYSSPAGQMVGRLSEPRRPDRIAAPLRRVARHRRRASSTRALEPDVEALLVNRVRQRTANGMPTLLRRADRRVLQAGRPDPQVLARSVGRHRGVERDRRVLRPARRARRHCQGARSCLSSASRSTAPKPVPFAATPQLAFKLRVGNAPADQAIQTIALRCQIQLEADATALQRRRAAAAVRSVRRARTLEPDAALDAVDARADHRPALRRRRPRSTLNVPCTFDFNVAATKYFDGLDDGDLPLELPVQRHGVLPGRVRLRSR